MGTDQGEAVRAAFRGVGACGAQNLEQLKAEMGAIPALMKEGHTNSGVNAGRGPPRQS
jgi:hypothetical protein